LRFGIFYLIIFYKENWDLEFKILEFKKLSWNFGVSILEFKKSIF